MRDLHPPRPTGNPPEGARVPGKKPELSTEQDIHMETMQLCMSHFLMKLG